MADNTGNVLLSFPARSLTDGEREIVRDWAAAPDGRSALVSERRGDDPSMRRRIVISRSHSTQPSFIVHAPEGLNVWVVVAAGQSDAVGRFPSLRTALDYVEATMFGPALPATPAGEDGLSGLAGEHDPGEQQVASGTEGRHPEEGRHPD